MKEIVIDSYKPLKEKFARYSTDSLRNILKTVNYGTEEALVINHIILKRTNRLKEYYSRESVIQLKREKEKELAKTKIHFGHKDESYFTEDEMLEGFSCNYKDLSVDEKIIFDRL